jgi:GDPmannose 4,6-dehydratase
MMQQITPEDYVICTGVTYTIREFLNVSFKHIGINNWENYIYIDPEFYRPAEVDYLKGKNKKAYDNLGWKPEISFRNLVHEMVDYDVQRLQQPGIQKVETASL